MLSSIANRLVVSTAAARYTLDGWFYRRSADTQQTFESLRQRIQGKPLLVVGNGPSLNSTPLEAFAHLPAIGMNKIDLLYPRTSWRPSLIVCVNNLVVSQHRHSFASSEVPVFLAWKCRWFMGRTRPANVHYFRGRATMDFSKQADEWVAGLSSTVTYTALQFAHFLGGDPVVLFGLDHAFDTDQRESGIARRQGPDRNHFDPDYFANGQAWGLPDLRGNEAAYRLAKRAFEEDGRRILDATIGGQLDVFPKISLAEARQILKPPAGR